MNEIEQGREDMARTKVSPIAGASCGAGPSTSGMQARVRQAMDGAASESLRSRAMRIAQQGAVDSARHERLSERLTPEIEQAIWCLQEAIALGLVDVRHLLASRSVAGESDVLGIDRPRRY